MVLVGEGGEQERGKQGGSRETNEPKPDRRRQGRPVLEGEREGRREGGISQSPTHSCCIASALPPSLPPSLPLFLPPFVPIPSNTTRGPAISMQCWTWGGGVGAGKQRACMTLDRRTDPRLDLLLGWSPLFLKQDGRAGRKKEDNDKREATHTRKRKRGVGGGGMAPSTEW